MSSVLSAPSNSSEMTKMVRSVRGAWQGGPCPECGDEMPANLVHCQSCRALLNIELTEDSVQIPEFVPLREINPADIAHVQGHYVRCPECQDELRINVKHRGVNVTCRFCSQTFTYDKSITVKAAYSSCPHCEKELRAGIKYVGQSVTCRFCSGPLMIAE